MKMKKNSQSGSVALFSAIMIMTLSSAMVFGLSTLFLRQLRIVRGLGDSVTAFYAANTGIEKLLYQDKVCHSFGCPIPTCIVGCVGITAPFEIPTTLLGNGASFEARYFVDAAGISIFESIGEFEGARRAIRVSR
ncbi:MAG: hypothetical protein LRZ96_01750 [Candidatus Pacebacteria bacterium]|nr:hypothetical protein [Candidatus Paceibacterota bacterium]